MSLCIDMKMLESFGKTLSSFSIMFLEFTEELQRGAGPEVSLQNNVHRHPLAG